MSTVNRERRERKSVCVKRVGGEKERVCVWKRATVCVWEMCVKVSLWGETVLEGNECVWKRKVCVCEREKVCELGETKSVCVREKLCVWERDCAWEWVRREKKCVCVWERENVWERDYVWEWERRETVCEENECVRREIECEWGDRQSVCVCVWEWVCEKNYERRVWKMSMWVWGKRVWVWERERLWADSVRHEYVSVRTQRKRMWAESARRENVNMRR